MFRAVFILAMVLNSLAWADDFEDLPIDSEGALGFSEEEFIDPGSGLSPSEQFTRVPLRPAMSDLNWKKWAGPTLNKIYQIHRGENLWLISKRLFGNPHLWPKVWQLNANIGNAHFIYPQMELQFTPGNPNAAPYLAWRNQNSGDFELFPMSSGSPKEISQFSDLNKYFYQFSEHGDPLVKNFFRRKSPKLIGVVPPHRRGDIGMFAEGQSFELPYLKEGNYSVIRVVDHGDVKMLQLLGYLEAKNWQESARQNVYIKKAFFEIKQDDFIVDELFLRENFPIRSVTLGKNSKEKAKLFIQYNEAAFMSSGLKTLGVKFRGKYEDILPGSVFQVLEDGDVNIAQAMLVDKDGDIGTLFVLNSSKEISDENYLR